MNTAQPALPQTDRSQDERGAHAPAAFRPKSVLLMHLFREMRSLERERRARLLALSAVPRA